MNTKKVTALFTVAGFDVLVIKYLVDGYSYGPEDPRFFGLYPRTVWYFVKTEIGWIEFGLRKRVLSIDWSDTAIRKIITEDNVTKDDYLVHAWSEEDAIKYLKALKAASQEKS